MDAEELQPYIDICLDLLEPLLRAIEDPDEARNLLQELGYAPPADVTAFKSFDGATSSFMDMISTLDAAVDSGDLEDAVPALGQLAVAIGALIAGVNSFETQIQRNFAGSPLLTETDILAQIARKLADYLIVTWLNRRHPLIGAVLGLAGIITVEDVPVAQTIYHAPYRRYTIDWDIFPGLLSDPVNALKASVLTGNELQYSSFLILLDELAASLGLPSYFRAPDADALATLNDDGDLSVQEDFDELVSLRFPLIRDPHAELALEFYPRRDLATQRFTGAGVGLTLGAQVTIPLSDGYQLSLKIGANLEDSLGAIWDVDVGFRFVNKLFTGNPEAFLDSVQFGVKASLERDPAQAAGPLLHLGTGSGCSLTIGSGSLAVGVERQAKLRIFAEGDLADGVIVLKSDDADGFLAKILPADGITANFSLGLGVANDAGLYFKGSSGLEIRLPVHVELGPLEIDYLTFGVKFKAGQIPVTATGGFSAQLGPLAAAVEDMGIQATFVVKADRTGNLGPLDVSLGFKPPKGVGLSIDAGVVKGGGYLFFDFDNEEYAGALELSIADFLSVKAIGLITTKMPDGSKGFSLLLIITAEFSPGLQLGYGFVLIGVGGLVGLNRTVVLEALAAGVRTGAVNGILFPVDPVKNAPRIISDLRTIFPPLNDHFLIGPMAKIGWESLISLSLGIIIEIPGNFAILGVLKAVLPEEDDPVLQLQVNFIGAIEFDKQRGYFFAALYDSRLLFMTIEGEMGVLIAVGADANFVLSVGGFHPKYQPPPLPFPSPKRIAFNIINTSAARIRVEGYFAITPNTAQTGASAELYFGFDSFSLQGHMGFDVLVRFSPFYLVAEITASASLKAFGVGVFSIDLDFTLEGPGPWRAHGRGSVSLLFISISANFDVTWGDVLDLILPPIFLIPLLTDALNAAANWRALPPPSSNLLVTLRKLDLPGDELVLHPLGVLEVSQNAIPLGFTLDTVGSQTPADANRFALSVAPGQGLERAADARRGFAPAQFRNLTDAQKLAAPASQDEISGIQLQIAGATLRCGRAVKRKVRYEITTIDTSYRRFTNRFKLLAAGLFTHFIKGSAVTRSPLSQASQKARQPYADSVTVLPDTYAVVFTDDNRPAAADSAKFTTQNAAQDYLQAVAANDPSAAAYLHIVPGTEANAG